MFETYYDKARLELSKLRHPHQNNSLEITRKGLNFIDKARVHAKTPAANILLDRLEQQFIATFNQKENR